MATDGTFSFNLSNPLRVAGWKELEEDLTCFYCCNLFRQPVTVPCLHTFCKECIDSKILSSTGEESFSCFICHTSFSNSRLTSVPVNFHVEHLVTITRKYKTLAKSSSSESPGKDASDFTVTCSQCCQGASATWWCLTCTDGGEMCEECYKCHCRLKRMFNSHKVIKLEEFIQSPSAILSQRPQLQHCNEHGSKLAEFYCQTCSKFLCKECNCMSTPVDPSKKHDVSTVDSIYKVYKEQLGQFHQSLHHVLPKVAAAIEKNVKMEQKLEETIATEKQWITMQFQEIRNLVDKHEEKVLLRLETVKNTTQGLLKSQKAGWNQLGNQMRSCDRYVTNVLQPYRSIEMISNINLIKDLGMTFRNHHSFDPAYNIGSLSVSRNTDCINVFAEMLGSLTVHHACHDPYPPNCTVKLASKCTVPVRVDVVLQDEYKLPVPNQLPHLALHSEMNTAFLTKFSSEDKMNGMYTFSYFPQAKKTHTLSVNWKNNNLCEKPLEVPGMLHNYASLALRSFGRFNKRNLKTPIFVAETSDGIVISDPGDYRLIFLTGLKYNCVITNQNLSFHPGGLAIGCNGCLYVSDTLECCILKYKKFGEYNSFYSSKFGKEGGKNGEFQSPQGLAVSKSGYLFVCDKGNHRIQVFRTYSKDETETFECTFGCYGSNSGCFICPTDLALNGVEDKLFVADTGNHRVQVFTPSGKFLMVFRCFIDLMNYYAMFINPLGICCTLDGHILVSTRNGVIVLTEDGIRICNIECQSREPAGITMKSDGNIIIAFPKSNEIAYCYESHYVHY